MTAKTFGFFKKFGRRVDNTVFPRPTFTVTKTLANANAIIFNISTNLTGGQTLNWDINGAVAEEFNDTLGIANTVTLAANGNAIVTKVIKTEPYAANGIVYNNTSFTFNVRAGGATAEVRASNTAVIVSPDTVPILATGGNVVTASNLSTHTFTTNGSFTISCIGKGATYTDYAYLIVGGGGGGGSLIGATASRGAGGGGGGGVIASGVTVGQTSTTNSNITPTISETLSVIIGNPGNESTNGGNTSFGNLIAFGGGRGGLITNTSPTKDGQDGGSGGGGSFYGSFDWGVGGNPIDSRQGYPGASGQLSVTKAAGGGGATSAGLGAGLGPSSGLGGNAVTWIDNNQYARGGNGGNTSIATSINAGAGGNAGNAGRAGIVKVRYKTFTMPTRNLSLT